MSIYNLLKIYKRIHLSLLPELILKIYISIKINLNEPKE